MGSYPVSILLRETFCPVALIPAPWKSDWKYWSDGSLVLGKPLVRMHQLAKPFLSMMSWPLIGN